MKISEVVIAIALVIAPAAMFAQATTPAPATTPTPGKNDHNIHQRKEAQRAWSLIMRS